MDLPSPNDPRVIALANPVLLAEECAHPRFHTRFASGSTLTVTVRAGWG